MTEFGLTGGIGSGKSSVSERLVARGAGLVDADATVKRLKHVIEHGNTKQMCQLMVVFFLLMLFLYRLLFRQGDVDISD